jgi:probable addiction module antidote protein
MPVELIDYDSAEHFRDPEDQAELLRDAIAQGDAGYLAHALGIIARARGMSAIADETGVKRQALYRTLSTDGNPTLETLLKVLKALDLQMTIAPAIAQAA